MSLPPKCATTRIGWGESRRGRETFGESGLQRSRVGGDVDHVVDLHTGDNRFHRGTGGAGAGGGFEGYQLSQNVSRGPPRQGRNQPNALQMFAMAGGTGGTGERLAAGNAPNGGV